VSNIDRAKIPDIPQIHKLVSDYANKGEMLARPLSELYEGIRDFLVVREGEQVVACAALHVDWADLAEIRSLAVAEGKKLTGIGAGLVKACLEEAATLGIETIFCFTYKPDFFRRQGFVDIDKMELPRKVWSDCLRCPKFPNCDETALIYHAGKKA
jgi:amino-acid N-acetyltransferase